MATFRFTTALSLLISLLIAGSTVVLPTELSALGDSTSLESATSDAVEGTRSADKTVYLVRHAEKCTEPSDNPGLTTLGRERAAALDRAFQDVEVDAIYSTPFERTLRTVAPLSERHGIEIAEVPIRSGFLEDLAGTIKASTARFIVVSGHSNTTPRMVNLLAGTEYDDLDESEYDRLYIVHLPSEGSASVSILRYGPESGPPESAC